MYVKLHYSLFCFDLEPNFGLVRLRPTIIIVASSSLPSRMKTPASLRPILPPLLALTFICLFYLFINTPLLTGNAQPPRRIFERFAENDWS